MHAEIAYVCFFMYPMTVIFCLKCFFKNNFMLKSGIGILWGGGVGRTELENLAPLRGFFFGRTGLSFLQKENV